MIDRVPARAPLPPEGAPLLQVHDLCAGYGRGIAALRAVDHLSLVLRRGEIFGAFGESRAGKSTLAHALTGVLPLAGRIMSGHVLFDGRELVGDPSATRALCGERIGLLPADPAAGFDPALTIGAQMVEICIARRRMEADEGHEHARTVLTAAGIAPGLLDAYPHQLEHDLRTRIAVAMMLQLGPELVIADDPTRGLDLTLRREIVQDVLQGAKASGAAVLWLTRDIALLQDIATRVAILYAGRVVEEGPAHQVLGRPAHPYTRVVLDSLPSRAVRGSRLRTAPGAVPPFAALPIGCVFRDRCAQPLHACVAAPPARFVDSAQRDHVVCCHRPLATVELAP